MSNKLGRVLVVCDGAELEYDEEMMVRHIAVVERVLPRIPTTDTTLDTTPLSVERTGPRG